MNHRPMRAAVDRPRAGAPRGFRRIAAALAVLTMLSPALVADSSAAQCAGSMSVRFLLGGCELSITGLTSPDGTTLAAPTFGLKVAGVECTYEPFSCPMGVGGLIKCFARMLQPFVQVEGK